MNGLSSYKNGKEITHHSTTVVTSVDIAEGSSSQKRSHSVISIHAPGNRILYSSRLTYNQNIKNATTIREVSILNPDLL